MGIPLVSQCLLRGLLFKRTKGIWLERKSQENGASKAESLWVPGFGACALRLSPEPRGGGLQAESFDQDQGAVAEFDNCSAKLGASAALSL